MCVELAFHIWKIVYNISQQLTHPSKNATQLNHFIVICQVVFEGENQNGMNDEQ